MIGSPSSQCACCGQARDERRPARHLAQRLERLVAGRREQRHRPRAGVAGQREHGERPERRQRRAAELGQRAAEEPRVVEEAAVLGLLVDGRAEQLRERRAAAHGVDHEVGARAARRCRCARCPGSTPVTVTPRRTSSSASAIRATASSSVVRRPVQVTNRSSPGRGARSVIVGGMREIGSSRVAPAASSARVTSGSSASSTWRPRDCRKWAWRNWTTPVRCHASQAASGAVGDRVAVALEDGDVVAVAGEHERGGEPADAAAEHDRPHDRHDVVRRRSIPRRSRTSAGRASSRTGTRRPRRPCAAPLERDGAARPTRLRERAPVVERCERRPDPSWPGRADTTDDGRTGGARRRPKPTCVTRPRLPARDRPT